MVWKVLFVLSLLVLAAVFAGETAFIGTIHLTGASVMIGYFLHFCQQYQPDGFTRLAGRKDCTLKKQIKFL